jgi:hypothetical protein
VKFFSSSLILTAGIELDLLEKTGKKASSKMSGI